MVIRGLSNGLSFLYAILLGKDDSYENMDKKSSKDICTDLCRDGGYWPCSSSIGSQRLRRFKSSTSKPFGFCSICRNCSSDEF